MKEKIEKWFEKQKWEKIGVCIIIIILIIMSPFLSKIKKDYYEKIMNDTYDKKEKIIEEKNKNDSNNIINTIEDIYKDVDQIKQKELEGKDLIPQSNSSTYDKDEELGSVVDKKDDKAEEIK